MDGEPGSAPEATEREAPGDAAEAVNVSPAAVEKSDVAETVIVEDEVDAVEDATAAEDTDAADGTNLARTPADADEGIDAAIDDSAAAVENAVAESDAVKIAGAAQPHSNSGDTDEDLDDSDAPKPEDDAADDDEEPREKRQSFLAFRKKALAKLHHARKHWREKVDETAAAEAAKAERRKYRGPATHDSVWDACKAGDTAYIEKVIATDHLDVRKQRHMARGETMLHLACWHGHLELVKMLVATARTQFGDEAVVKFVNKIDTLNSGTAPLIEAARSVQGYQEDRLDIFRFLVEQGARLTHQDAHGDNALHWAVRRSNLGLVRHILREQELAVLAAHADNHKLRKPIDVAVIQTQRDKHAQSTSPYQSLEIYGLLLEMLRGSNMRMKIQSRKRARIADDARRKQELAEEISRAITAASEARETALVAWTNQNRAAETQRMKEEKDFVSAASERAIAEAHSWLEGPYGKLEHKNLVKEIKQDMKEKVHAGTMQMPKDVKAEARRLATEKLVKKKDTEARQIAVTDFRNKNPHTKEVLKRLKLPTYSAGA